MSLHRDTAPSKKVEFLLVPYFSTCPFLCSASFSGPTRLSETVFPQLAHTLLRQFLVLCVYMCETYIRTVILYDGSSRAELLMPRVAILSSKQRESQCLSPWDVPMPF